MWTNRKGGKDRSINAAAWAWHGRGIPSLQVARGAALMISRRNNTSSCRNDQHKTQRPSRFKREAEALLQSAPSSSSALHDQDDHAAAAAVHSLLQVHSSVPYHEHDPAHHDLQDYPHHSAAAQLQENQMIGSADHHFQQTSRAAPCCRFLSLSPSPPPPQPAGDHYDYCDPNSPVIRRRSASLLPVRDRGWTDKLCMITGRKSMSSGVELLHRDCSTHQELETLISLSCKFSSQLNGDAEAPTVPSHRRSSLFDSFELQEILKKLGYDDDQLAFRSSEEETPPCSPAPQYDHHDTTSVHRRKTLHDLLGWSDRDSSKKGCSCRDEEEKGSIDHYDYCESPEINCSSSNYSSKAEGQQRPRRRGIPMPHLPHSFSNALHHPFSSALHQIAHLTHSLSSAYRHHVASLHRQNADNIGAAPSPAHHHARTHRHLIPFHLSHFLSNFKSRNSPPHPSCGAAFDLATPAADCRNNMAPAPVSIHHNLKSSPSFDQNLSTSNDYMLIYNSIKKHCDDGAVHHHHHHHYHYIFY